LARDAAARAASKIVSASHASVGHIARPARAAGIVSHTTASAVFAISRAWSRSTSGRSNSAWPSVPSPTTSISRNALLIAATAGGSSPTTAITPSDRLYVIARSISSASLRRHPVSAYVARDTTTGFDTWTTSTTSPTVATSPEASVRESCTSSPLTRVPL